MISVVIPMYNSKNTIIDAVDAVLNQTRIDVIDEIIIVNDGSTDNCETIVREKYINHPLIHVIDKENGGVSSARNLGIKHSQGDWIALLDSDDVWKPDKIEKQIHVIDQHPEIQFLGANRNDEMLTWGKRIDDGLYYLDLKHILIKNWPHTSTALIKKSVLDDVGLFNEHQKYAEDGELWNRIAYKYGLYYLYDSLEIAGGNKLSFGVSGLSANLRGMYQGNIHNIQYLKNNKMITAPFYWMLRIYYYFKYVRRIVISKKVNNRKQ